MKRFVAATLAIAVSAGAILPTSSASADSYRGPIRAERDARESAIALGIIGAAAGFIVGSTVSGNGTAIVKHHVAPAPRHSPHPMSWRQAVKPQPRHAEPWSHEWYRYCSTTYRSFNPATGTWRGYDGRVRFCEAPLQSRHHDHRRR